jgi:hypothetical protein
LTYAGGPVGDARVVVVARLRARRGELVDAIFARMWGAAFDHAGAQDAEYLAGLRATVAAALEYVLTGIERGETVLSPPTPPVPAVALEQARRAARLGVPLDTVLRRYVVGSALLGEYVMEEADRGERDWTPPTHPIVRREALRDALRAQASGIDRLLQAITVAHTDQLAHGYDGVTALPALLRNPGARRARECLLFIADQNGRGLSPSNREVATAIGITHQPQISRLLAQLAVEGLVSKTSHGLGRPNAWRLTPRGGQVLRMLAGGGATRHR